jgi:glutamate dehydrogenase
MFDPSSNVDRRSRCDELREEFLAALADVPSLDYDRIFRMISAQIDASVRTNAYQADRPTLAVKFETRRIADAPMPRPQFEIFVSGPKVEGVHLRMGAVARGGLRWSDRPEDFRTEVLGLMKAQAVKNAVIVPAGAKGGFVVRKPVVGLDRAGQQAEGIGCYQTFIGALLDVTDNVIDGLVVPPADTVRWDSDDPYLVVAADKGTATFSDIANAISLERHHWLGDAFASGGSVGYDHKAMGITARGAWESVKRHFLRLGRDITAQDATSFTVVGIGDMSGDVFGNGMLLSKHIALVAAFDHRHIFLDPTPDPATSFAERARLFALPRSSWDDYDKSLVSAGGGIWPRTAKSITLSVAAQLALGMSGETVKDITPNDLLGVMLRAPVDLLWNGGIGTYIKSSTETHSQVGDKANDSIRADATELRCAMVGEGGNLGVTQRGRIEFASSLRHEPFGTIGWINTDAIDNSAGVDTSDHEVNLKILLDQLVREGAYSIEARNELLATLTDDVADHVLADNIDQNRNDRLARPLRG